MPQLAFPEGHPAWPGRCHLEDGDAISPATLQMIACNADISAKRRQQAAQTAQTLG